MQRKIGPEIQSLGVKFGQKLKKLRELEQKLSRFESKKMEQNP